METVNQHFTRLNRSGWPCAYSGDRGDWVMVCVGQSRDSGCLEQSNFATAYHLLSAIDSDNVAIESASHWAVGWVESLLINPAIPALVEKADDIAARLADYPVLNEEDFSEREWTKAADYWESLSPREKVRYAMEERKRYHWLQYEPVWRYGRMDYHTLANDGGTIANAMCETLRE